MVTDAIPHALLELPDEFWSAFADEHPAAALAFVRDRYLAALFSPRFGAKTPSKKED